MLGLAAPLVIGCGNDSGSSGGTGGSGTGGTPSKGTGGAPSKGTGGASSTGGAPATGGVSGTGGAVQTGSVSGTGGATHTGGASGTGGRSGTGGATHTGGAPGTGGATHTGGASGTGGAPSTGGVSGTGGAGGKGTTGGACTIPAAAMPADVSSPTTVVGNGTAANCTASAVVAAVAAGGVVTFNCGTAPLTITVPEIQIINDGGKTGDGSVTIDGGGTITLSGGGTNRILYQDTCNQSLHFTTSHCQAQDTPHLVLQNIGFTAGSATATSDVLGGGAIYVGGGTFRAYNIKVTNSTQPNLEQDYAGGAIYTFNQATQPVYIVNSTFDSNSGCNGGALGSIGTSWSIYNSVLSNNKTLGNGANPAQSGTPGGGLGGAIYNDGDSYTLTICGTVLQNNTAAELGSGSIFEVVDDLKGALVITGSTFTGNSNTGSVQSSTHPSIYVEATDKAGNAGVTITSTTFN